MFTRNVPPMFTQNVPCMFARNVPPMFARNVPCMFTRMHYLLRACPCHTPGRLRAKVKRLQGGDSFAGTKARPHTAMNGNVLRLIQKHLLFQSFAALSAEAVAADDDHLGAMQEAIQACRGQQGIAEQVGPFGRGAVAG
jgi:hypothetical protein